MSAVIGNLMGGNVLGAISSLFHKSPLVHVREAVTAILKGEDVDKNMEKLQEAVQSPGGDRQKMAQVGDLLGGMDSSQESQTSTMEKILTLVDPDAAKKMGISPLSSAFKSGGIQF